MTPKSQPLRAVLFDLDGTLIATKRLYLECYRRALASEFGRNLSDEELLALEPHSEIRLLREQLGAAAEEMLERFYADYAHLHTELFEGVYPGVAEALEALRAARVKLGVVTGKSSRAWEVTRLAAQLGDFDALVFDDHVALAKPDPSGLTLALAQLALPPGSAMYVGDSYRDLKAAEAAGVRPAAALWSKRPADRARFAEAARSAGGVAVATPFEMVDVVLNAAHGDRHVAG